MIRFVDFGRQILGVLDDSEEFVGEFGFYNTVDGNFFDIAGIVAWECWDDFEASYFLDFGSEGDGFYTLQRFKNLVPRKYINPRGYE